MGWLSRIFGLSAEDRPRAKRGWGGGTAFASIYGADGERHFIGVDDFKSLLAGLERPMQDARDLIERCRVEDVRDVTDQLIKQMTALRDDIRRQCDDLERLYLKFRRGDVDLEPFREVIAEGLHLATVLAAAVELQVSPATLEHRWHPLTCRFRLAYVNSDNERGKHGIDAVAYSVVGDRAYLWGVINSDVVQFRVDRIEQLFEGRKQKPTVSGNDVADWLARRALK